MFNWLKKWFGSGTADDWRNPFWRLTEFFKVTPEWSRCLIDIRLGFRWKDKWHSSIQFWTPVIGNFWNGIFTFNVYVTKANIFGTRLPFLYPRFNLVIRPMHAYWFAWGVGILFDRGEFGWTGPWVFSYEGQLKNNPDCITPGWDAGPV